MADLAKYLLTAFCGSIVLLVPLTARGAPHAAQVPAVAVPADPALIILAQAGSSGGAIGKRGRSVSGSDPAAKPAAKTRSLGTKTRAVRRAAPVPRKATRTTRTTVRAARGRCISGTIAGYAGRVCY